MPSHGSLQQAVKLGPGKEKRKEEKKEEDLLPQAAKHNQVLLCAPFL